MECFPIGMTGWVPFGIRWEPSPAQIDWRYLGSARFTEPFFDQTIERRRQGRDRVTALEALDGLPAVRPPDGFIFHLSRCGSTLVSQMLAAVPSFIVISEATILSSVLQATGIDRVVLLRKVVNALLQPREGEETRGFIKFHSAAMQHIPVIAQAFPHVRWIFLYRDPLEVISRLLRIQSETLPPGLIDSRLMEGEPDELRAMRPAEFWARVLASRCESALREFRPGRARLVNYTQLPDVVWTSLLSFFGAACSEDDVDRMRAASKFDAKDPSRPFVVRREVMTDEMRAVTSRLVMPLYERLESIRLSA